jgi:type I restriction enzyme S subunit
VKSQIVRLKMVVRNQVVKSDGSLRQHIELEDLASGTGHLRNGERRLKAAEDSICHDAGDVLFSKLRPYLAKSYLPLTSGTATGELLVLRPGAEVDSRYLFYVTLSTPWVEWANATSYGSKMPRTSWEAIGEYRIWLPSLDDQRRIADFLDAETARVDEISNIQQKVRNLLLNRLEIIVDRVLGVDDGVGHGAVPLKYLASKVSVGIVITPAKWYVEDSGVLALRGINVKPGKIILDDTVRISRQGHDLHAKSTLRAGDIVIVRTGQAGAAAVVGAELDGCNCIDLVIVRPGPQLVPRYLEYVLNSGYCRRRVTEYSVGSIQSHFNVGAMKQVPIRVLSPEKQRSVVKDLDQESGAVTDLVFRIDRQLDLLSERRQALITAAVTGQLDISSASGRGLT